MKSSLLHLTHDDTYGPGTDLAMALVGIFILYVAINLKTKSDKDQDMQDIRKRQEAVVKNIADSWNASWQVSDKRSDSSRTYVISIDGIEKDNIIVNNKNSIQTITFGDNLLFDVGLAELKGNGQEVMQRIGSILQKASAHFEEIQVQGHADIVNPGGKYTSNIELASARATTVFTFLRDRAGLDPAENLMSIVSFGEYKPAGRISDTSAWNMNRIKVANESQEQRDKNRRIEIVLIYR